MAIVHAHAHHTIAISLVEKSIVPNTAESLAILGSVPVIGWDMEVKLGGLPDTIAESLKDNKAVMVHGHGSFAAGQLLEQAHDYTAALEETCHILCLLKSFAGNGG